MSSFLQLGHNSHNLLQENDNLKLKGVILSPVNYDEEQLATIIKTYSSSQLEMIFDPQLYYPNTQRNKLVGWQYFPSDVDTADKASIGWWNSIADQLIISLKKLNIKSVCSPTIVPATYSPQYFSFNNDVANEIKQKLDKEDISTLLSVLIRLEWLTNPTISSEIGSIITASHIDRVYLLLTTELVPRRELHNTEELIGAMRLISMLEEAGVKVLVSFASSDVVLWKSAGASDCATGKFYNLRRFTKSRWEEPSDGGGQISYWFEESLMAFLRESDLIRVRRNGLLSEISKNNPYGINILKTIDQEAGEAWLGESWRQYLYWFSDIENRMSTNPELVDDLLKCAETNWAVLEERKILMAERQNDGSWIRAWRRALYEYK